MEYRGDILKQLQQKKQKMRHAKRLKKSDTPRWRSSGKLLYAGVAVLFLSVVFALFSGDYAHFLLTGIGFVLLLSTAALTTKGVEQSIAYKRAVLAKAPRMPYKTAAMVLLGITIFYLAYVAGDKPLFASLFVALLGSVGYGLYYGLDPRRDKLPEMGDIDPEMVLETLQDAESKLTAAAHHNDTIDDMVLQEKVENAITKAHQILDTIRQDPKDFRVARKFLVVFVDGIADVTRRYTEVESEAIDPEMRQRLHALMDDLQQRFDKELARLKSNNLFDLDVTIDALKAQVNH